MDKIRVLLVEDEPTLAMIIKDTLDGEEFEVILAANGEEGLSRYGIYGKRISKYRSFSFPPVPQPMMWLKASSWEETIT